MKKRFYIALLMLFAAVGNAFSQSMTISGGNDHGLIICAQGYLYTWGNNMGSTGGPYLGIDPQDPKYGGLAGDKFVTLPAQVKTDNLTFSQVTAGSGAFNLALSCHKVVYAWGDNNSGACGQGSSYNGNTVKFPVPVLRGETSGYTEDGKPGGDYLGGVKWVAGSTNQGFAITEDDRVVCWGVPGWTGGSWLNASLDPRAPSYVRDKAGNIIENVTHISGGDDNVYMRTADGKLYSIGNCNGFNLTSGASVNYAVQVLKSDGTELDNIRMSAAGDKCGFAVTNDGFLWGWGDSWGGCPGIAPNVGSGRAQKVSSGDYKDISGEAYLTDVTQVIGGRGHGAAITKEGYLLYWGVNDGSNGGVAPDPKATAQSTNGHPIFAFYCKEGTCDQRGDTVKNAVAISRGDNFDFMVNDKDEYYAWGLNDLGQLGIGSKCDLVQCLKKIETIPCEIQDVCPSVFMIDVNKCPGEEIELDCGYVVPIGKEKRYYIEWYYTAEGETEPTKLNKSDIQKGATGNYIHDASYDTDPYNKAKILITKPGRYKVIAYYVGANIPCDACEPSEVEIEVKDMDMPVDTVIIDMQCAAVPMRPAKTETICFEAVVNDKFYKKATDKVTFAAFATATSKDTLVDVAGESIVVNTTGNGGEIKFCVPGNLIEEIVDNKDEDSNDTIYNVWIEDITQFETTLLEKKTPTTAAGNYYGSFTQIISMASPAELKSFSIFAAGLQDQPGTLTVTPIILRGGSETTSGYTLGSEFARGKKQTFTLNKADGIQECKVLCDLVLPVNSVRGSEYVLAAEITINNGGFYTEKLAPAGDGSNSVMYGTPYLDSEKFGIKAIGSTSNGLTTANPGRDNIFWNITFGKMTDYDCGRIMLSARYGCPPCKKPDLDREGNRVSITVNSEAAEKDTKGDKVLELCKETPKVTLNINKLLYEGVDAGKTFDVLWFDQLDDLDDAKALEKGNASSLVIQTDWTTVAGSEDIEKDVEKMYYVMVRDNEKSDASACFQFDSIKVIAHPVPLDTLKWIEFCVGMLEEEPTFEIAGKTINWVTAPTAVMSMEASASFDYTVTDDVTGCEGPVQTLKITVNSTEEPDVKEEESVLMDPAKHYSLSAAVNAVAKDCEIKWYKDETDRTALSSAEEDISLAVDGEYTFWAEQVNTETGCVSKRVKFTLIINDAPLPLVKNESLCIGDKITSLESYVSSPDDGNTYQFNWYSEAEKDAPKGTGSTTAPSFEATETGKREAKFYVSQTNLGTGAESEKVAVVVKVHDVATLDLSANNLEYCIGEPGAKGDELTFSEKSDGDFTKAFWSDDESFTTKKDSWTPDIDAAGDFTFYVQPTYTNKPTNTTFASEVCKGKVQSITIKVNKTETPTSEKNFSVQYMKDQQPFKPVLTQEPKTVISASGHTLKWYKEDGETPTSEPTPKPYLDTDKGDKREIYWVSQVDNTTGCESEKVKVTIVVSGYPMPEVENLQYCQPDASTPISAVLTATITEVSTDQPAADFTLVWYDENPEVNENATEYTSINLEDYAAEFKSFTGKEYKKSFFVRQRYKTHTALVPAQSAASELVVTVYARPILTTDNAEPICKGDKVDLSKYYEVSNEVILKVNAVYADDLGNELSSTSFVSEAGTYQVQGYFHLDAINQDCKSDWGKIKVTVDELAVAIDGSPTTCPGVPVELTPIITTNVKDASKISYSWSTSAGVKDNSEIFSTTEKGLEKTGNKVVVDLSVTAGACLNVTPEKKHEIEVGDGLVSATLTFTEKNNAQSGKSYDVNDKKNGPTFSSCNGNVTVKFTNVEYTDTHFTFTSDKGHSGSGEFSPTGADFGAKIGTYVVSYNNECPTQFTFTIRDVSISLADEKRSSNLDICEDEEFSVELTINHASSDRYIIEWYLNGDKASPLAQTGEKLLIKPAKVSDSGVYSYKVSNESCSFEDKIAQGLPLTVKPKIKIGSGLVTRYEVTREDSKAMSIPFDVPADPSEIASGIMWQEDGETVLTGADVVASSVMKDHHYNVVVDHEDYCGTSVKVDLYVDALLQLKATIDAEDMCVGENHILTVDTTGTGRILHSDKFKFVVEEIVDGVATAKKMIPSNGLLQATISPNPKNNMKVEYKITYVYTAQENQDKSNSQYITVHPAYDVQWTVEKERLCDGEATDVVINRHYPEDIKLDWVADEDIEDYSELSARIRPHFNSLTGYSQEKRYTLIATSEFCKPREYYPRVTVDKPLEGEIVAPEFSCEGSTLDLDASSFHATSYEWYSDEQLGTRRPTGEKISVVPVPEYAEFFVDMERGACKATATHATVITLAPKIQSVDSLSYRNVEIVLESGTGTAPFQFIVDGDNEAEDISSAVKDLDYGEHEVLIVDAANCKLKHKFYINSPLVVFQKEISPNGDNVNDRFYNKVLADAYPNAVVRVFDRWGKTVAEYKAGSNEGWDGTYNGNPLPSTDYWYEIQIAEIQKTYVGHFTLLRQ